MMIRRVWALAVMGWLASEASKALAGCRCMTRSRQACRRIEIDTRHIRVKSVLDRILDDNELGALAGEDRGRFNTQMFLEAFVSRNLNSGETCAPEIHGHPIRFPVV